MTTLQELEPLAAEDAQWRSQSEQVSAVVDDATLARIADVLDGPPARTEVPPMWLSMVCTQWPAADLLGPDGHPRDGVGYPPIPDRRRVFAGARVDTVAPVHVGDVITRTTRVSNARAVQGKTGAMLLVTLQHRYCSSGGDLVAREEQDLAYRSGPAAATGRVEDAVAPLLPDSVALVADTTRLFRFSALTANSHRIHYDLPYATGVEGLPGLLVHGPLMGLLLLEVPRRASPDRAVRSFELRVRRPATAGAHLLAQVAERGADTWSLRLDAEGATVATAQVSF
jgi:3-methylfumaryl-CoA hydratase